MPPVTAPSANPQPADGGRVASNTNTKAQVEAPLAAPVAPAAPAVNATAPAEK